MAQTFIKTNYNLKIKIIFYKKKEKKRKPDLPYLSFSNKKYFRKPSYFHFFVYHSKIVFVRPV